MKGLLRKINNNKTKPMFKKIFSWTLNLCMAYIFLNFFFFHEFSIANLVKTKYEHRKLKQEVSKVNIENLKLQKENVQLNNDPKALERIAREKYGMHKQNEKVYRFYSDEDN